MNSTMLTDIWFRGYSNIEQKWFFGYLVKKNNLYYIQYQDNSQQVLTSSIGIYTGYKYNDGTMIFSGDIIKHHTKEYYILYDGGFFIIDRIGYKKYPINSELFRISDIERIGIMGEDYEKTIDKSNIEKLNNTIGEIERLENKVQDIVREIVKERLPKVFEYMKNYTFRYYYDTNEKEFCLDLDSTTLGNFDEKFDSIFRDITIKKIDIERINFKKRESKPFGLTFIHISNNIGYMELWFENEEKLFEFAEKYCFDLELEEIG